MSRKKNGNKWGLYDPRAPYNVSPVSLVGPLRDRIVAKDGYVIRDATAEYRHVSARPTYSTSPVRLIPGTSSIGRAPTSYSRRVYSQVTNTPFKFTRFNGDYREAPIITNEFHTTFSLAAGAKMQAFFGPTTAPWSDVDLVNDLNRAKTECLLNLADNKVDLGVALAELGKTISHLASTGLDLWGTVDALRKRDFKRLLNILSKRSPLHRRKITAGRTAAQYWLEYNYAWKPLFQEAYGLYTLLKTQLEPALLVHASRTISGKRSTNWKRPSGDIWYAPVYSCKGKVRYESTCRLTGRVNSDKLRLLAQGMTNPATVLWELVPYSFVVDWSIPIGNFLAAATATQGLTFVWGSTVQRYQASAFVSMAPYSPSKSYNVQYGEGEVFKFGMERIKLSAFPRPVLYTKSPFSYSHLASAVALFRQLI